MRHSSRLFVSAALGAVLLIAATAGTVRGGTRLFFVELQAVGGYATAAKKFVAYSMNQIEARQKPSLGFDLVQRFSGKGGDVAVLAVQGRLAWNADKGETSLKTLEPQLYNAYLRFKLRTVDLWVGHNKPRFGLSYALDNHGMLLQPLAMSGYGFDRDWGVGLERDTSSGSAGVSLTTGSGMSLRFKKTYFLAARIERGVLSRDNFSGGFSLGYGTVQNVLGNHLLSDALIKLRLASFDLSWVRNNWENRIEMLGGGRDDQGVFLVFWRTVLGFLDEYRLKLEIQPVVRLAKNSTDAELGVGATYALTPDWTLRGLASYDTAMKDFRFVVQIYFYKSLGL
jgi:hypothetical protein